MIEAKGISFSSAALFVGALLVVLASAGGVSISGAAIKFGPVLIRAGVATLGLIIVGLGIVIQILESRGRRTLPSDRPLIPPIARSPEQFFLTLDDEEIKAFPQRVRGATKLQFYARTMVNVLSLYGGTLRHLAEQGCRIQILLLDPDSDAARIVYGENYTVYQTNSASSLENLKSLQADYPDRIETRFIPFLPTLSIINVDKRDASASYSQAQLYFLKAALGRDRPMFTAGPTDKWYQVLREEFDILWAGTEPQARRLAAPFARRLTPPKSKT